MRQDQEPCRIRLPDKGAPGRRIAPRQRTGGQLADGSSRRAPTLETRHAAAWRRKPASQCSSAICGLPGVSISTRLETSVAYPTMRGNGDLVGHRTRWRWEPDAGHLDGIGGRHERGLGVDLVAGDRQVPHPADMSHGRLAARLLLAHLHLALVAQDEVEALLAVENRQAAVAGIRVGAARNDHDGAQRIEHALEVLLAHRARCRACGHRRQDA